MLTRAQKETAVTELRDKFARASGVLVADYRGLSVQDINELRSKLRTSEGCEYQVAKNTLLRRAVAGSEIEDVVTHFSGPTAVAFSYGEALDLVKTLVDYAKDHDAFELKGGIFEGRGVDPAELATLATLPSLDELRGKLVGLLQAPAQKIAAVLQAPAGQLARVVGARHAQLEESGGGT